MELNDWSFMLVSRSHVFDLIKNKWFHADAFVEIMKIQTNVYHWTDEFYQN